MKPLARYLLTPRAVVLLMLCSMPLQTYAESGNETPDTEKPEAQPAVKAWLDLQSSGEARSKQPQPLSGPAMERVHERYLKNFTHPVPPYLEHADRINY
jgi:hypothetical protein